jgi:ubiquinone/menaquinone biosynthesis C-methylase UbiE
VSSRVQISPPAFIVKKMNEKINEERKNKIKIAQINTKGMSIYNHTWGAIEFVFLHGARKEANKRLNLKDRGESSKILDACFGTGLNFKYFADMYPKAEKFGIEFNSYKVSHYKSKGEKFGIKMQRGDVTNLSYPDSFFDGIIITLAITCVSEPLKALNELARVLKRKGRLVILSEFVPHRDAKWYAKVFYNAVNFINDYTNDFLWTNMRMPVHDILQKIKTLKMIEDKHYMGKSIHLIVLEKE